MHTKSYVIIGLLLATTLLTGCEKLTSLLHINDVKVNSLPLIQQQIISQVPLFKGKRDKAIMDNICAYVSGYNNKDTYQNFYIIHNLDLQTLANGDNGYRFIATADKNSLMTSCAAYIASTFFTQQALLGDMPADISENQLKIRLMNLTPIALATIKVLAEISAETQGRSYASLEEFKKVIGRRFRAESETLIAKTFNSEFLLADYDSSGRENGYSYSFDKGQVGIYLYGDQWLGNGKIMGTRYFIYLNSSQLPTK